MFATNPKMLKKMHIHASSAKAAVVRYTLNLMQINTDVVLKVIYILNNKKWRNESC